MNQKQKTHFLRTVLINSATLLCALSPDVPSCVRLPNVPQRNHCRPSDEQLLNNEQRRWWTAFEQWTKTAFGQLLNNEQRQPFYPSVHTVQLNKDSLFILCAHRTVVTVYLLKCVHAKLSVETACMHASWMKGCDLQPWTNHSVICRVGQNPFFCIFGVHTVFQAGKWPYIR
jgi:hypothetical protein